MEWVQDGTGKLFSRLVNSKLGPFDEVFGWYFKSSQEQTNYQNKRDPPKQNIIRVNPWKRHVLVFGFIQKVSYPKIM